MTSQQIVERLLNDISLIINAKKYIILKQGDITNSELSLDITWISQTSDVTMPYNLHELISPFNYFSELFNKSIENKVELVSFYKSIEEKKLELIDVIERLKSSPSIKVYFGVDLENMFGYLKKHLDRIHEECLIVHNCHERLLKNNY